MIRIEHRHHAHAPGVPGMIAGGELRKAKVYIGGRHTGVLTVDLEELAALAAVADVVIDTDERNKQ